jgi:hypothetical protein
VTRDRRAAPAVGAGTLDAAACDLEKLLGGLWALPARDAGRGRHATDRPGAGGLELEQDPVDALLPAGRVGVGHQQDELVALRAGDEVIRAGELADDAGSRTQDRVANCEAVRDVEPAEAVDVDHRDRQRMAVPAGAIDLCDEALMEAAQVRQVGQRIAARAHAELALELAESPVGVAQLLLEQPALLFAIAEHGSRIGKTALLLDF